ncbi:MAG: ABC transporter ATP-binding protein [Gemmatimonadota bacterium]|nr:MAG: ABC transporter ATP-binding protein [Gemmatimonadota bacterium]
MIEARGLVKRFGSRVVLDDLDFTVERGRRLALLGLNGAGKTTLLRCLMGLLAFEGSVLIDGVDVATAGKRARGRVGYVPQRPPLFSMTLGSLVEFFSALRGIPERRIAGRLEALGLPLDETAALSLRELSGGMVQKALLAVALAADPPVLLLDEPTANLDPQARGEFMRVLRAVDEDTTLLLASHRLDEVEMVADRIWILHDGRRVFDGTLDELRAAARADSWLWIRTVQERRDDARQKFIELAGEEAVMANGKHVAVQLPAAARVDALSGLRQAGVPIEEFWVVGPSLEEIVRGFFVKGGSGESR